jgi:hypothetical protein
MREKLSGGLSTPTPAPRVSGNGLDGTEFARICKRDRDRSAWIERQQKRQTERDRRAGKRGFGGEW